MSSKYTIVLVESFPFVRFMDLSVRNDEKKEVAKVQQENRKEKKGANQEELKDKGGYNHPYCI
jgi:molybdopterin-guanine dinucleotide biosynthesis protein